ncbi:MAG: hypothetical protein ISN29_00775 [Gammaproteobacteria bacterium AqS3]|nr:hypothetical protein [Gammaproteobacteria bacterium AqS3]
MLLFRVNGLLKNQQRGREKRGVMGLTTQSLFADSGLIAAMHGGDGGGKYE